MESPEISIMVISYNTSDMTLACIDAVFKETQSASYELIILDNASKDGSAENIARTFGDRVRLIKSSENHGFAQGNNVAAEQAQGEYLLLLNPDTVVLDDAIDKLLAFAEKNPEAKIWGGRTLFGDNRLNPASCWSRQTLWSLFSQALGLNSMFRRSTLFNPEGIGGWDRAGVRQVDIVSGCFFLIKRDFWQQLGGFRKEFFMYGEEADLCLRAAALGAKPMVTSDATIVHYGGASETVRADKMVRLLKAKTLLIRYHFAVGTKLLGVGLLAAWPLSRFLAHKVLSMLGVSSSKAKAAVWGEIFARRGEWMNG